MIPRNILAAFSCLFLTQVNACIDDDAQIAILAAQQGRDDITACVDVLGGCNQQNQIGQTLRQVCCQTCSDNDAGNPVLETNLPPTDQTVDVYLLSGQSECYGQAEAIDLDSDPQGYPDLQGDISGVWYAGYTYPVATDRYFIAPMNAGNDRSMFGPEISFGERMYAVTGRRTLVMKYCVGGTNVHTQWNPDTEYNSWDTSADDGTAEWMANNAGLDFDSKKHLFKNLVYTIRRTKEALTKGGVTHEWKGIVWVQGAGDSKYGEPVWKAYGENLARVWNGFRNHIGSDVSIIDTGAGSDNQIKSGKEYASQLVEGCRAKNVGYALVSNDDTSSDCISSASNPCSDATNLHVNLAPFLYYGIDPNLSEEEAQAVCPNCNKTFHWYRLYPQNLHSGYEGMILKGRMLANAFVREFTDFTLPPAYADTDPITRFPLDRCPDGVLPSDGKYCWIDYRDESMMIKSGSDLCAPHENTSANNNDISGVSSDGANNNNNSGVSSGEVDSDSAAFTMGQGYRMIVGTAMTLWLFFVQS